MDEPTATAAGTFEVGDREVNRLGYGAMRLCGPDILGPPEDPANAQAVLGRAVDLDVNFIDTADAYGPGVNERQIATALDLTGAHADVTVATKAGLLRSPDGDWIEHGDPDYLQNEALVSRDRLGVDSLDLLQLHAPDPTVAFEDSVTALAELKDRGVVDHVGLSNVSVEQLDVAREHVAVATVQNQYNVAHREHDPVLDACEDYGVGFLPYFPLAPGGFGPAETAVTEVADAHDTAPEAVALAWLLDRSPVVVPIPGTSSVEHLVANVGAAALELTDEQRRRLDEAA
jgi:hypothetical protein